MSHVARCHGCETGIAPPYFHSPEDGIFLCFECNISYSQEFNLNNGIVYFMEEPCSGYYLIHYHSDSSGGYMAMKEQTGGMVIHWTEEEVSGQ